MLVATREERSLTHISQRARVRHRRDTHFPRGAFVLKTALSDFYVEYQLNAIATNPADRVRVLDRLHANILDSFNEYGVQIMSPHYMRDPPQPAVVPRERWYEAPAVGE